MVKRKKKKSFFKRILVAIFKKIALILIGFFLVSVFWVLSYKFLNPYMTYTMMERIIEAIFTPAKSPKIHYSWVYWKDISSSLKHAVIAAEDQRFLEHWGFDFEQIQKAVKTKRKGKRIRGASTISQQVAKNAFLWNSRSYFRKGLEAYFTILIEVFWSKERILEVYLNIAEMGDMIFGVEKASDLYFNKLPKNVNDNEAALLAAVMPNPIKFKVRKPSNYVVQRQGWILRQMRQMGSLDL